MGLRTKHFRETDEPPVGLDLKRKRFGEQFPRVFALVYSLTGNEAIARDVSTEAFSRVLTHAADLDNHEFVTLLFATARNLCRRRPHGNSDSNLDSRERELLALTFAARLSRDKVRRLMSTTEEALSSMLLRTLGKLREGASPAKESFA